MVAYQSYIENMFVVIYELSQAIIFDHFYFYYITIPCRFFYFECFFLNEAVSIK